MAVASHRRRTGRGTALLACVCLSAGACAVVESPSLRLAPAGARLRPEDFPGRAQLLEGFAPPASDAAWRAGDAVLFGVCLRRGGDSRCWLLHVAVDELLATPGGGVGAGDAGSGRPPPDRSLQIHVNGEPQTFCSQLCRATVTVADPRGQVLGRSQPLLPRDFLARGFGPACHLALARIADHPGCVGTDAFYDRLDTRPMAEAMVAAMALLQVVQEDDVLSPLLWQVVQRPSLWSVVGNLGVRVVVQPRFHETARAPAPALVAAQGEVFRVPVDLLVNDALALQADLVVGEAWPPLALCGGILAVSARHPQQPGTELSLLLLAAQRGPQRSLASGREIALDSR